MQKRCSAILIAIPLRSSPRKTDRGAIVLSTKRSKSLRMDGQTIQGKCPDMKTIGMMNLRKMKVPLRKLHHQQTSDWAFSLNRQFGSV
jgi:hypothetical protein